MIDFHSHILPAIDDGANDVNVALEMLSKSYNDGVDTVVSTSHCYITEGCGDIDKFLKHRTSAYNILKTAIARDGRDSPEILLAAEVHVSAGMSRCENLPLLRIPDTDYILLEMPYENWTDAVFEEIYHVIRMGMRPIIAHLDRYPNKEAQIRELLSLDVLCQINAGAFLNKDSRKMILRFLKSDAAHVIGSDMHNMTSRSPNLAEAYSVIEDKFGSAYADFFESNSKCILHNGIPQATNLPKIGFFKKMFL